MGRPRKDRPRKTQCTRQQAVWDFLTAEGPKTQGEIIAFYGRPRAAKDVIAKLMDKGCVRHIGPQTWGKYEAIGERPTDERGMARNSTLALNRLNQEAKEQKQAKRPKAVVHGSAFDQCIAWFCRDSRVDKTPVEIDNDAPQSRPEVAEAQ